MSNEKQGRPKIGAAGFRTFGGKQNKVEQSESHEALTANNDETLQSNSQETTVAKEDEVKNVALQPVKDGEGQEGLTAGGQSVKKAKIPPHMKQQTFYLPKELAHWLKVHAAITEQDVSTIITRLIEDYRKEESR